MKKLLLVAVVVMNTLVANAEEPNLNPNEVIVCHPSKAAEGWISIRMTRTEHCSSSTELYNAYVAIKATEKSHIACEATETPQGYTRYLLRIRFHAVKA